MSVPPRHVSSRSPPAIAGPRQALCNSTGIVCSARVLAVFTLHVGLSASCLGRERGEVCAIEVLFEDVTFQTKAIWFEVSGRLQNNPVLQNPFCSIKEKISFKAHWRGSFAFQVASSSAPPGALDIEGTTPSFLPLKSTVVTEQTLPGLALTTGIQFRTISSCTS